MSSELEKPESENNLIVSNQVQKISDFLNSVGLPSENILADETNRSRIGTMLPQYIYDLPPELKREARYLSKFVVGAAFGLFDYALNSVWNEVVLALRQKAIMYGIEIFFDNAVGGTNRAQFKKEEDLAGLKDIVLLDTSKKLELISETTYKKLAHILDMRNDIGVSHPTDTTIRAFELMNWLEVCVEEVLKNQPSPAALQIKAFIENLKSNTDVLDIPKIDIIKPQIESLATHHCDSILRTIFGLYVNVDTAPVVRKNVSLISPIIWNCCSDEEKYKLGLSLQGYNINLHQKKYQLGEEFFTTVSGNNFRTKSEIVMSLNRLTDRLKDAHEALNNYYNEVPIIERIMTFISKSSDIPVEVAPKLIRTILLCRVGKGASYYDGVSPDGKQYYDQFFNLMSEEYVPRLLASLTEARIQQRMNKTIARNQAIEVLKIVRKNTVSEKYNESLDYLITELPKSELVVFNEKFKQITSSILTWNK